MLAMRATHISYREPLLSPSLVPIRKISRIERRHRLAHLRNRIVAPRAASGPDAAEATPDDSQSTEFSVPFWTGQAPHFLGVVALAASALALARSGDALSAERLLEPLIGTSGCDWFRLGLLIPILHQMMVVISWRVQLNYKSLTRAFGKQGGQVVFFTCFTAFAVARFVVTVTASIRTSGVLWKQGAAAYAAAAVVAVPFVYVLHSVFKYLGFQRLAGVDHFDPEYYRKQDVVNEGAFKHLKNPIYTLGVLGLLIPGIATGSLEGIALGLYQYLALWVLYFSIERVDMAAIYKNT
ncbi:hypothetical protein BSKO_08942 [Bryopsis sp. KO-2023]|nr:hypothetical protein BSKO_08942 [Bryopsis sp. KO-2023]